MFRVQNPKRTPRGTIDKYVVRVNATAGNGEKHCGMVAGVQMIIREDYLQ